MIRPMESAALGRDGTVKLVVTVGGRDGELSGIARELVRRDTLPISQVNRGLDNVVLTGLALEDETKRVAGTQTARDQDRRSGCRGGRHHKKRDALGGQQVAEAVGRNGHIRKMGDDIRGSQLPLLRGAGGGKIGE